MHKLQAAITAVHGYAPDYVLTNQELEALVDTNDEWITSRTGIKERRILKGEGTATSDLAVPAVEGLLKKRGIGAEEIDLIIFCTTTPDMIFPATANILAAKIGAVNAWGYDLQAACSGFVFGLATGAAFIESGKHKKVLVVGGDKMSSIVNYQDRATCIIFGDGCGCALLEPDTEGYGIIDSVLKSDGSGREFLHQLRTKPWITASIMPTRKVKPCLSLPLPTWPMLLPKLWSATAWWPMILPGLCHIRLISVLLMPLLTAWVLMKVK
jgi:3-oxoacyl-[acyl-carrier-protein] synthase-3